MKPNSRDGGRAPSLYGFFVLNILKDTQPNVLATGNTTKIPTARNSFQVGEPGVETDVPRKIRSVLGGES